MYSYSDDAIYCTLYGSSQTVINLKETKVSIAQKSGYPFDGEVTINITPEEESRFDLKLRIPTWTSDDTYVPGGLYKYKSVSTQKPTLTVNGKSVKYTMDKGFAVINRKWSKDDVVKLELPMPVKYVESIPEIKINAGTTSIVRGPLVYCAEEIDNDVAIQRIYLADSLNIKPTIKSDKSGVLAGITQLAIPGYRVDEAGKSIAQNIELIPYYAWSNRGDNKTMMVWLNNSENQAKSQVDTKRYIKQVESIDVSSIQNRRDVSTGAICDGDVVSTSQEHGSAVMKWLSDKSSKQSVEINLVKRSAIEAIQVFWLDEEPQHTNYRLPKSWSVDYKVDGVWRAMELYVTDAYETNSDKFNVVHPAGKLECDAFRINIIPQNGYSVGISEVTFE